MSIAAPPEASRSITHLKGAENKHCDFEVTLKGKIRASIARVICATLLTSQCSCQVARKFCIDNSTAKFISLVVQTYLAGLAIAISQCFSPCIPMRPIVSVGPQRINCLLKYLTTILQPLT